MELDLVKAYKPRHPILPPFGPADLQRWVAEHGLGKGVDLYNERMTRRNERLRLEEKDPLNQGFEPAHWYLADLLWGWIGVEEFCDRAKAVWGIPDEAAVEEWKKLARAGAFGALAKDMLLLGGMRSSKTTYMLKRAVQCLVRYPKALIWVFHEDLTASIKVHHLPVWNFLPKEWKEVGKGQQGYVSWKEKTGFAGMSFIGPQSETMMFKTYGQKLESLQGYELGDPEGRPCIGAVCDELVPLPFVQTLGGRCATRSALLLRGFTPIQGHSSVVAEAIDGARRLATVRADDLGDETLAELPLVLEKERLVVGDGDVPEKMATKTMYYPSRWNPFNPYKELRARNAGMPLATRAANLYGYTEKTDTGCFPLLNRKVHGFSLDKLPEGTDWMVADPAGARQWFMLWCRVDAHGRRWYWRQWPSARHRVTTKGVGMPGRWAEDGVDADSKFDGVVAGSGQSPPWGFTLEDYLREVALVEKWAASRSDEPVERWKPAEGEGCYGRVMDSRTAAAPTYRRGEERTLMDEMADLGLMFTPAEGKDIEVGVQLINDGLGYQAGALKPEEGPHIFICDELDDLWWCLERYKVDLDRKDPRKDPVDCLRYMEGAKPFHVPKGGGMGRAEISKLAKLLNR